MGMGTTVSPLMVNHVAPPALLPLPAPTSPALSLRSLLPALLLRLILLRPSLFSALELATETASATAPATAPVPAPEPAPAPAPLTGTPSSAALALILRSTMAAGSISSWSRLQETPSLCASPG
jgi:hypothetical protein